MKIQLMSDLHFEFGWQMKLEPHLDTILVLAGDVDSRPAKLQNFINSACANYAQVIMVAGNHEFYGNNYQETMAELMCLGSDISNFHFLENSKVMLDDVLFLGGTLWSEPEWGVFNNINDHHVITFKDRKLLDNDIAKMCQETKQYIKKTIVQAHPEARKTVVVTHFGPDQALMHPRWLGSSMMNTYFWADGLQDTFQHADYWFYGHTHDPGQMELDGCNFVCNPCGYIWPGGAGRENWNFNENLIIEI